MNRKIVRYLSLAGVCVCLGCFSATSQGFRSIGIRLSLSWGETPIWLGIEASTDLSWTILSAALFITPDGKTLFTSHFDIPLREEAAAFLRITAGFYYFEPRQPFPYPLAGVGLSYLPVLASPIYIGFAGEFVYPLAFPLPMFSISGGWLP
ncbi:hypothetical protein KAJ02_09140 [Candidatus Bipolaricaulota bacterium]|nr:hypothetical protein [Candidatus Bipolaricaulota bacterium]MCK5586225.1 hypothetical protein [Candidatus Bipolaricaulota bacterium]